MNQVIEHVKEMFNKSEEPFTAERAWIETTYGNGSYRPIEKRIKEKQEYIKQVIKSKFGHTNQTGHLLSRDYRCVIDIEEDLKNSIDEILKPFREGGFDIINLSEKVTEIQDENVFLFSWKNPFK